MSYTEIFGFSREGTVKYYSEVRNSHRGAMAVWCGLEKKYLPSLKQPDWATEERDYWFRTHNLSYNSDKNPLQEVWSLFDSKDVSRQDKIIMGSTFDKILVKREDLEELCIAFESSELESSLKEQAEAIREIMKNDDLIAIGFNQTSVNADTWARFSYDEEEDETVSYNCLTGTHHWWLFDEINKEEEK